MAVKQRIITARISTGYGVELYYDEGVKFTVTSDTGPVSSSGISGSDLNYDKYTSSGGANGDGISYSKLQVDGFNGGTSYHSWFNIYWDKTDDYDASTVGIPDGINNLSETGVSINLDEDDCPRGFDLLTASTPSYIYLKAYAVNSADNPISTKVAAFDSSSEITLYLGYNSKEATLTAPGTPTITENYDGTYTARWSAATGSGGSGSVYYQWWDVNNGGYWSNWSTATSVTLRVPSYGYNYEFRVRATYDGASSSSAGSVESWSSTISKTFTAPSVTAPGAPTIVQKNGGTYTASWTKATGSYGTGDIYYQLQNVTDNIYLTSRSTNTSVTLNIPSYGSPITFRVKATYGKASSSSDGYSTAYSSNTVFTFHAPALTNPGTPTIVQNNDGTYTAKWTAATGSYGVGNVYYQLWNDSTGTPIGNLTTALTGTYSIASQAGYDVERVFKVKATYNNASNSSDGTVITYSSGSTIKTFSKPTLSAPTLSIVSNTGATAQLSWTEAILTNTTGTVSYSILVGNTVLNTTTSLTYTIPETIIAPLSPATISVQANATELTNTDNGSTLTTISNNVIFTYKASFTGASNLKVTGTNTAILTWTAGATSYGSLVYDVYLNNNLLISGLTNTNYSVEESLIYDLNSISFYIQTRNITTGDTAITNAVNFTYSPIFAGASNLASNGSGSEAVVSWTAGSISYGTITYDVYVNGRLLGKNLTKTSYTILEPVLKNETNPVSIYIVTKASPQNLTAQTSAISFTYIPSEIKHTVGYRRGGRNHNCLVYVNVNGAWIKCAPHIYKNGKWQICSTT